MNATLKSRSQIFASDRDYLVGPLTVVDFLIGPRFDSAPALLDIDISPYKNIDAWLGRLRAKPYWKDA